MRQICNDNIFPLFINKINSQYLIINLVSDKTINIVNILENKKNTYQIDPCIVSYHNFLLENGYNPSYYELKTNNMNQFLNILYLDLLDEDENEIIKLKKKNYIKYLEMDTKKQKNLQERKWINSSTTDVQHP